MDEKIKIDHLYLLVEELQQRLTFLEEIHQNDIIKYKNKIKLERLKREREEREREREREREEKE